MNIDLDELYGNEPIKFKDGEIKSLLCELGYIAPSDEAIEEINKLIEEGNKPVKKPFPYRNIESITIDEAGNWTIKGDKL